MECRDDAIRSTDLGKTYFTAEASHRLFCLSRFMRVAKNLQGIYYLQYFLLLGIKEVCSIIAVTSYALIAIPAPSLLTP